MTRFPRCAKFAGMRPDWLTLQCWGAIIALALFVLSTTPHDHDGAECVNGTCVPCHVQSLPFIDSTDRSGVHETPDASVRRISFVDVLDHPRNAEIHGKESRAPPG